MADEAVFTFTSVNRVIKAEAVLAGAGLSVRVMPLHPDIRSGCGLCLRVDTDETARAESLLRNEDAPPEAVYLRTIVDGKSVMRLWED